MSGLRSNFVIDICLPVLEAVMPRKMCSRYETYNLLILVGDLLLG